MIDKQTVLAMREATQGILGFIPLRKKVVKKATDTTPEEVQYPPATVMKGDENLLSGWQRFCNGQTEEEVHDLWSKPSHGVGMCIPPGMFVIDFDEKKNQRSATAFKMWRTYAESMGLNVGVFTLQATKSRGPVTGKPGCHCLYFCPDAAHETKSPAIAQVKNDDGWSGLVDLLTQNCYIVVSPTPGYKFVEGRIEDAPTLTLEEHKKVQAALMMLDERPPAAVDKPVNKKDGLKSWEEFNQKATAEDMLALLVQQGAKEHRFDSSRQQYELTRPGKDDGISGTLSAFHKTFICFSSNWPGFRLEHMKSGQTFPAYSPFGVYALVNHNGDMKAAAADLFKQGFGDRDDRPGNQSVTPDVSDETKRFFRAKNINMDDLLKRLDGDRYFRGKKPKEVNPLITYSGRLLGKDVTHSLGWAQSIMLISGWSGARKTSLISVMFAAGLDNKPYFDLNVRLEDKPVLFIDTDQGENLFIENMDKLTARDKHGQVVGYSLATYSIDERKACVTELVSEHQPRFLVIDNLGDFIREDSEAQARDVMEWLKFLRGKYNLCIIVTLHLTKSQEGGARGHLGSIADYYCDSHMALTKFDRNDINSPTIVTCKKIRGGAAFTPWAFTHGPHGLSKVDMGSLHRGSDGPDLSEFKSLVNG